eukprot:Sspe_Gene.67600::Locus_39883_Transcript_1_1_Confidence_1.000_Length_948::g.67600::m.67600
MATAAAGHSFAKKRTGKIPKFPNIWRSLLKLMTVQPGYMSRANIGNRAARHLTKAYLACFLYGFPLWLGNKYGMGDLQAKLYISDPDKYKSVPQRHVANTNERSLAFDTSLYQRNDPWSNYVPSYNSIPWMQVTRDDNPNEEAGWKAFGTQWGGVPMRGMLSSYAGYPNLYGAYLADPEYSSYFAYLGDMYYTALTNWYKDIKWNYYDAWKLPVEERRESLGPEYGRRIGWRLHNQSGGMFGMYLVDGSLYSIWPFPQSVSY